MQRRCISPQDAWALIAMADRINNGRYVKFVEYQELEDGTPSDVIAYRPNRSLIRDSLEKGDPVVTDTDRRDGAAMSEHFQGLALNALAGDISSFDRTVFALLQKDEIDVDRDMAYLSCLGSRWRREVAREKMQERVSKIGETSRFQGEIGENIQATVSIISSFSGRTFSGSVVRATDGKNLYFWTSAKAADHWPREQEIRVTGAVKGHNIDQYHQQETRLTRVKLIA